MMKLLFKKFKTKIKNERGFSLLELLLYIGIFSMLLVTFFQLLTAIFDVQLESSGVSSVDQDGLFIMNRLSYDIKHVQSITTPASAGQTAASLVFTEDGDTYNLSVSSGNLVLADVTRGTSDRLNSVNTTVSAPSFTLLSDTQGQGYRTITFVFTVNSLDTQRNTSKVKTFKTTVGVN